MASNGQQDEGKEPNSYFFHPIHLRSWFSDFKNFLLQLFFFFFFSCVHPSNYNSFPYFLPWVTHSNRYLCFTYNEPKFHCGCWGFLHQRSKLQQQLFSKTHKIICSNGFSFWLAQENINKNEKLKIQVAIPWKASFSDCL